MCSAGTEITLPPEGKETHAITLFKMRSRLGLRDGGGGFGGSKGVRRGAVEGLAVMFPLL